MGSDSIVSYAHSLTHSLTQTGSIEAYASLGSKLQKSCEIPKFDFFPSYLLVFSTFRILDIVVLHSQVQFLFLSTSYLIFSRPRILLF